MLGRNIDWLIQGLLELDIVQQDDRITSEPFARGFHFEL